MSFGGALVEDLVLPGNSILICTGLTLDVNAGAFNLAADDSGGLSTANIPTAGADQITQQFGPGQGRWDQGLVNAVTVVVTHTDLNANSRVAWWTALVGDDLEVYVHSVEAGAVTGLIVRLVLEASRLIKKP